MGDLSIVHGQLSIGRLLHQECRIGDMWRSAAGRIGRSAWVVMVLAGVGLIVSNRVAARQVGDRPWIARMAFEERADDPPIEPWPEALGKVVLPEVSFDRDPRGSLLPEIV